MENQCSTQTGSCQAQGCNCASCQPKPQGDCCPVQMATDMWSCAFHEAMKQAHVEVLKAKIHKSWGPKMDKMADAVLETMEAQWGAMLAKGKSKMDLKDKIAKAMMEGKK